MAYNPVVFLTFLGIHSILFISPEKKRGGGRIGILE